MDKQIAVMVVGSGPREDALVVWLGENSPEVGTIYCVPGNDWIARRKKCICVPDTKADEIFALGAFASMYNIDLTIFGQESPLIKGGERVFNELGLTCLGPSPEAAEIEGSKAFAKEFFHRYGIPTPTFAIFTDREEAKVYIRRNYQNGCVVKVDGPFGGKGVVVADDIHEACGAVDFFMGENGVETILVESRVYGREYSIIGLASGTNFVRFPDSEDYQRLLDGDQGPTTGGMGANSPPRRALTAEFYDQILRRIIRPTLAGLAAEGRPYTGFIYFGIIVETMTTPEGMEEIPMALEVNCREGDPEAQVNLPRITRNPVGLILDAINGNLTEGEVESDDDAWVGIVVAPPGYSSPEGPQVGLPITGLGQAEGLADYVFGGGLELDGQGVWRTTGRRVVTVVCRGKTLAEAREKAYRAVEPIVIGDGVQHFRRDIALQYA